MRYSQLFGKTSKTAPSDADSTNAKFLTQGGFIYKQMAGVYVFLPLGLRVLNKIQNIIREEMNSLGASEVLMPALTQLDNYIKTGRDSLDILFRLKGRDDSELVLNLSHEEVVTPLVQGRTFSYRDLPVAVYQIQNKFRNEPRAKSGLLRGREFNMKDLYSFHASDEDLDSFYNRAIEAYFKVYQRLGIGEITLLTFASGGSFSRYSHEFQALSEVGEDTIFVCENCKMGVNKELIDEHNYCPKCQSVDLKERRAIEVGNIFKLGTRYSDAFGFKYTDDAGKIAPVIMGCYGIGPSRLMGTIVEIFHDEKGILWPESVAPFRVQLISLGQGEAELAEAEKIYSLLTQRGVEVLFDDRANARAGEKFADADLIGLPYRMVVSKKTMAESGVEFKKRADAEAKIIPISEALLVLSA